MGRRPPRTVPVTSRDAAETPARTTAADGALSVPKKRLPALPTIAKKIGFTAAQIGMLIGVTAIILVMLAYPLRNYFQQRGDIAREKAAIAAKKAKKQEMLDELDKYRSDAYVKEQARRRLGLVEPGVNAFRIIAPENAPLTTNGVTIQGIQDKKDMVKGPWWDVLWASVATPDSAPAIDRTATASVTDSVTTTGTGSDTLKNPVSGIPLPGDPVGAGIAPPLDTGPRFGPSDDDPGNRVEPAHTQTGTN